MLKEKVAYWSGPAAAIGGILHLLPTSGWLPNISDTSQLWMGLPGLLLIAVGLTGLHLQFRAGESRGSVTAIGLALAGVLLVLSNMVIRLVNGPEEVGAMPFLVIPGMLLLVVGLVVMGVSALSRKALGTLSFVPLALAVSYVSLMISLGLILNNPSLVYIAKIVHLLVILGWLLLGAGLWFGREETAETALQM